VLAVIALAVIAGVAFGGGGSAPPERPLARAIHDAATAPAVQGVTARVNFTSNLFGGATTDTSSALLTGGSGRLWASDGKLRLELQSDNGDAQIVVADGKGFVYDGPSDTAYTFALPRGSGSQHEKSRSQAAPTLSQIASHLSQARRHASISRAAPGVIAGEPAYSVRVTPRAHGGLLGAAAIAWDAARGVPLRLALYARGASKPAVELVATDINFSPVDSSVFALTPPKGAKVVDLTGGGWSRHPGAKASRPSFSPNDPSTLAGRARRAVKPLGDGGAVVLYGNGLDTIAILEHAAKAGDTSQAPKQQGRDGQPLELPTVTINGAKGTAIGTPLGGVIRFERGGVAYTVAGSQRLAVLEAAARGL
jgi:outer membrane lipoprotein-sorting protein